LSPEVVIVVPSVFTDKAVPAPPDKPSPETEAFNWVAVIPAFATSIPLGPAYKVVPDVWIATEAAPEPSNVKSEIPLPSVNEFPNVSAVIPDKLEPSPSNEPDKTTEESGIVL
jgi:hypothetical protein